MTRWPAQPVVYEVNTWVWLEELTRQHGRRITLRDVPSAAWDEIAVPGVDAIWLMGVWERSETGRRIAMADEALLALRDLRLREVLAEDHRAN